jgi:hypothetical protein
MKKLALLCVGALFAASTAVADDVPTGKLVDAYAPLAGSQSNAESLVNGLRDGGKVTLKSGSTTVSFTPPTGKMGIGNVDHSLALAQASLEKYGITDPTPQQLEAALMGGDLKLSATRTVELRGVLQMRADGMGWGKIANQLGLRLGDVVSAGKRPEASARGAEAPVRMSRIERPAKPERVEKPERPVRPERPERPGR